MTGRRGSRKAPLTPAEKQRRYRERQKAARDIVRAFLCGLIADTNSAIASGAAPPWLLARSARAVEILETVDAADDARPALLVRLVALGMGARDGEEKARMLEQHEREFAAWLGQRRRSRGAMPAVSAAAVLQAETNLRWAETERVEGRSTAASLTVGLNACKRLVGPRRHLGTAADFAAFSAPRQAAGLDRLLTAAGPLPAWWGEVAT